MKIRIDSSTDYKPKPTQGNQQASKKDDKKPVHINISLIDDPDDKITINPTEWDIELDTLPDGTIIPKFNPGMSHHTDDSSSSDQSENTQLEVYLARDAQHNIMTDADGNFIYIL